MNPLHHEPRTWRAKFRDAFRGIAYGLHDQSSFRVHLPVAAAVLVAALLLQVAPAEWCLLVLAITAVLATEMLNTALEHLAKAITDEPHPRVRAALDIGSAAVLSTAGGAATVGAIIFLHRVGSLLAWW